MSDRIEAQQQRDRAQRRSAIALAVAVHAGLGLGLMWLLPELTEDERLEVSVVHLSADELAALLPPKEAATPDEPAPEPELTPAEQAPAGKAPPVRRAKPRRVASAPSAAEPAPASSAPEVAPAVTEPREGNPFFDDELALRMGLRLPSPETAVKEHSEAFKVPTSGAEAAREKIGAIASYTSPGLESRSGARVLEKTWSGGYRWVDPDTGEPVPDSLDPKQIPGALLARSNSTWSGNTGSKDDIMFRDVEGLPPVPKGDALVPTDAGGLKGEMPGYNVAIAPDGSIAFDENIASYRQNKAPDAYSKMGIPAADLSQGSFDLTDMAYRIAGIDPYGRAKACLVDETEDIRVEMRREHDIQAMSASAVHLRDTMERVWGDDSHFVEERKEVLFELWDDCDDGERGRWARDMVESFIRINLPEGSAVAFTDAELARFNQRRISAVPFRPYG